MRSSYFRIIFALTVSFITMPLFAQNAKAEEALACGVKKKCPTFTNLFNGDKDFRRAFVTGVSDAHIKLPKWVPNGVSSLVEPVEIEGRKLLSGSICQPHFCDHSFSIIYDVKNKRMVGQYSPDSEGIKVYKMQKIYFGKPNKSEQKFLEERE